MVGTGLAIVVAADEFVETASWLRYIVENWTGLIEQIYLRVAALLPFELPYEVVPVVAGSLFLLSLAIGTRISSGAPKRPIDWSNVGLFCAAGLAVCIWVMIANFLAIENIWLRNIPSLLILFGLLFRYADRLERVSNETTFGIVMVTFTYIAIAIVGWWIIWAPLAAILISPLLLLVADIEAMGRRLLVVWLIVGILLVTALFTDGIVLPMELAAEKPSA